MAVLLLVPFSFLSSPGKNIVTVLSYFKFIYILCLVVVRLPPRVYEILTLFKQ